MNAALFQIADEFDQILDASAQSVQFPNYKRIAFSQLFEGAFESGRGRVECQKVCRHKSARSRFFLKRLFANRGFGRGSKRGRIRFS